MTQDITPISDTRVGRIAGPPQGLLLVSISCLSVLGAVLLAPAQPRMLEEFADTASATWLVPMVVTTPALMVGLLAAGAGRIVDAVGRLRLLTAALVLYAICGTAPILLDSLVSIVVSRVGVGIAEAALMTCCTTLIADYFDGKRRARYFGLQVVFTSLSAVLFIGLGGGLAQVGWRAPFFAYAVGIVFAIAVPFVLFSPKTAPVRSIRTELSPMRWRALAGPLAITVFGGIVFYTPIVEIPLALSDVGITGSGAIGLVSALAAVATAIGAISFSRVASLGPKLLLPTAFGTAGVGVVVIGTAAGPVIVAVGGIIASAGCGVLLPTLLTWVLGTLDEDQRGRGTGAWTACLFIGQFLSALVVLALGAVLGGLSAALIAVGVISIVLAFLATRMSAVRMAVPAFESDAVS
ncbi:MAG: MFS transporter [Rhodococcus sp. (in: high G+C Gram-positive bacteria)]